MTSISLSAVETGAGLSGTYYKIVDSATLCDTSNLLTYTGAFIISTAGTKKVCYRSIDLIGNNEPIHTSNTYTISSTVYYQDADGDGYGNPSATTIACALPSGYVTNTGDCLDSDARVNPTTIWWSDDDGDGFSDGATSSQCNDPGTAWYQSYQLI